jgi:hypothetical protein
MRKLNSYIKVSVGLTAIFAVLFMFASSGNAVNSSTDLYSDSFTSSELAGSKCGGDEQKADTKADKDEDGKKEGKCCEGKSDKDKCCKDDKKADKCGSGETSTTKAADSDKKADTATDKKEGKCGSGKCGN